MRRPACGLAAATAAVAAAVIAVAPVPTVAAEYYARSSVGQTIGYDDNPNFSFDSPDSGQSLTSESSLSLNAGVQSPAFQFDTNTTLSYSAFPDQTDLNSFDQRVGVTLARRTGLSRYGLQGNFISDTTRTTDEVESGKFVDTNSRRYVLSAGPFLEAQIDPLNSLTFSGLYTNQDRVSQNLPDFEQYSANALWTHILTPRTQAQAALNGFFYNSNSGGSNQSQSIGVSVGGLHQFTPRLSVRFLAGPQYSIQESRFKQSYIDRFNLSQSDTDSTNTSLSYQIDSGLTYQLDERTDIGAGFTRSSSPSTTSGVVTESNTVNFFANHDLLRSVSVGTTASYVRRTQLGSSSGNDDLRDLVTFAPRVSWQIQNDLRLSLNYAFRWQREDDTGDTTTSNGVFLTVNYDLPRLLGDR